MIICPNECLMAWVTETGILYLPLWAATSTGTQDMLPALFSGLVYTIDLLQTTVSSSFSLRWRLTVNRHFQNAFHTNSIHKIRHITPPKRATHLLLFISLHLVRFQQEHLEETKEKTNETNGNYQKLYRQTLKNAPTCSLCFLSFSISSILFFLMPSCSMRQKHLNQKETS